MPPESTTPEQQAAQPESTGQAAAPQSTSVPVQQVQDSTDWEKRFKGLQATVQQLIEQNRALEAARTQQATYVQSLEGQLQQNTGLLNQATTAAQSAIAQAQQAQADTQFYTLLTSEFPDLVPIAGGLQRVGDIEQQRQILASVRQGLNGQINQQVQQQVRQTFSGVTPGAAPAAGSAPALPSFEDVMGHVLDDNLARSNPAEWNRWYEIYQNHPDMGPASLDGGTFRDPFANPYQQMQANAGQQPQQNLAGPNTRHNGGVVEGPQPFFVAPAGQG